MLAIFIPLALGYLYQFLINKCQNISSSPVHSTTARTDDRRTQTGGAPYVDNAQQSSSATNPESSSVQPPQSETAIPPLHSPLPSKDMHASTSHAQSSIELTPTSEDHREPVERFYSSRDFIGRFVDDYDSGEMGNSSTENAQSATTGEHIQLERFLSARDEEANKAAHVLAR
nr:hypothetical protein CFP56_52097 [Quercus suber]